jgi:hypothetical protein
LGTRNVSDILYQRQISAALDVEDIPLEFVWTRKMWEKIINFLQEDKPIGPTDYPGCQHDIALAVKRWLPCIGRALVIGSVSPWIEAILYSQGCRDIVTLDLAKIHSQVEELKTVTYSEWERVGSKADLIVSFSTVEHIGLGRYGDQQDEDADVNWMRYFALLNLKPNGVHLLGVPVGETSVSSAAHRIYGPDRMKRMTEGWRFVEAIFQGRVLNSIPFTAKHDACDWQKQPILVLKPNGEE